MDPDSQFQDPTNADENEDMQMIPTDQFNQSDNDQQMIDPPDIDNNLPENSDIQRSVNITNESNISDNYDEQTPNNIVYNEDEEDRFLSDDQIAPPDDIENDTNNNVEKVKALSEKEEDQPGNLEDTTNNIAMALLPQINEDENESKSDNENHNNDENITNNENEDTTNNEIMNADDKLDDKNSNDNENTKNDEIMNADDKNSNDNENTKNDEILNADDQPKDDQNPNENENTKDDEIINNNDQSNDIKDLNDNENTNEIINATENTNENEAIDNDENANADENAKENINNDESKDEIAHRDDANEEHPSEEGMEVKDNLTPQRFTRQRRPYSSTESLSKLPPLSTDPDLDAENLRLLNNFKKKGRLPDTTQRAQLFQYIQREKVNSVVAQKFGKAQEYQNILQKYQKAIIEQEVKDRNYEKMESLKSNLETIEEDLKQTEKETKNKIGDEKEKQKEHYYNIIQKQDEELDIFERKWNDPNFIQKYAKPSSTLLAMKTRERSMVLTKMFDQAEYVHNKVKEREKIESKQAQELAETEMNKEKQKILAKQDSEIEAYKQQCNQQIELIRRNHEVEKKKKQEKIQKIKDEIQELKRNPPTSLPPMAAPCQEMMTQSIMTPRTLRRYTMYKTQSKKPVLTLNPLKNVRPTKRSRTKFYSSLS